MTYCGDMHICEYCGEVFDHYECECHKCGGLVVEAERCAIKGCMEYMPKGDYCCDACKKEAVETLSDALAKLWGEQVHYLDSLLELDPLIKFWREN